MVKTGAVKITELKSLQKRPLETVAVKKICLPIDPWVTL